MQFPIEDIREMFPALSLKDEGRPRIYFDNPAGSQVPQMVMDAVSDAFLKINSNSGAFNATSVAVDAMFDRACEACADFLGTDDPGEVFFGPSMTNLTFHMSRCLAQDFQPGDEIIITRMEHEGNVAPWLSIARDKGLKVRFVPFSLDTWQVELEDLEPLLNSRTRLLALNYASNMTGSVNNIKPLITAAKKAGALVYVDAVQLAPHQLMNVKDLGCDFLVCSSYKFFGPHLGLFWGKREILENTQAYKCRCSTELLPRRFMLGTPQFELIAGLMATVEYFAELGRMTGTKGDRRSLLAGGFKAFGAYEDELARPLLQGLAEMPEIKVYGMASDYVSGQRVPTVSFTHQRLTTKEIARSLANSGVFCHWGHNYAFEVARFLGLDETLAVLRVGLAHYNTIGEVEYLLDRLRKM
jgi:cysteine desulfurase family protein (TIGR01976 family)